MPVPPRTGLDQSASINRPRSIGDVVVRAHIRCELRHHRLHLQLALRVRQQRLHHLRLLCSPAHQTSASGPGVEGAGAGEGPVSVARVFSRSFRCTSRIMRSSCSVFCTAGRTARAQRRGVSAGLMAATRVGQAGGSRCERRGGAARTFTSASSSVSLCEFSCSAFSFACRASMETFAIAGGGGQRAGGVPCGLGWRTSVPRSFVSSADCACSILSTSTISCFTLRVATCHRQRTYADGRRRGAEP